MALGNAIKEILDETQGRDFLFSVVIPVYNTDEYVAEAIESILTQTIGFEEYIQLVLVNDGSVDNSAGICRAYQAEFPSNIVFIDKENEGVSIARKTGLEYARGSYINFLDSDDYWSEDAFQCAADFFEQNPDMCIVTARCVPFGREGLDAHPLVYEFDMNKNVDIRSSCDHPQLSVNNTFINQDCFDGDYFNPHLSIAEDFFLINEILLRVYKFGIIATPNYYYRKHLETASAQDTAIADYSWYFDTLTYAHFCLFELSRRRVGEVIPYIQYCVMYDLQWRLGAAGHSILSGDDKERYRQLIIDLLQDIDIEIILAQRNVNKSVLLYALALKYSTSVSEIQMQFCSIGKTLYWDSPWLNRKVALHPLEDEAQIILDFISYKNGSIECEGRLSTFAARKDVRVTALTKTGIFCEGAIEVNHCFEEQGFSAEVYYMPLKFTISVPAESFSLYISICGTSMLAKISFGRFCPLSSAPGAYAHVGSCILTCLEPYTEIEVEAATNQLLVKREALFELRTFSSNHLAWPYTKFRRKAIIKTRGMSKRIWLISDRPDLANDNGEALFSYLQQHPIDDVETYFILKEDSMDYQRLSAIGNVVPFKSNAHLSLFMQAEAIISSSADDYVIFPFEEFHDISKGLQYPFFIFLQHGVTLHDLSSWLNRYNKNIRLFITSAPREQESITDTLRYGYSRRQVVCTGFPRHDILLEKAEKNKKRRILIAPTWRNVLALPVNSKNGTRPSNPLFEKSDYFHFYNALINDECLIKAAKKTNYDIRFLVHPSFSQELSKFSSKYSTVVSHYQYSEELSSASIMLTDYSSIVFDFALLKRPIVYSQFDKDSFYNSQVYVEGYFNFENDGFGPVVTTYEQTVAKLIEYMELDTMPEEYANRVDEFFYWPDRPRCEIVTEAIINQLLENGIH